jgi:preprotein translocase subunit SecE
VRKIINYLQGVRLELSKVTWPKKEETVRMTLTVIVFSAIVAGYVGILDFLFTTILTKIFVR